MLLLIWNQDFKSIKNSKSLWLCQVLLVLCHVPMIILFIGCDGECYCLAYASPFFVFCSWRQKQKYERGRLTYTLGLLFVQDPKRAYSWTRNCSYMYSLYLSLFFPLKNYLVSTHTYWYNDQQHNVGLNRPSSFQ